MRLFAIFLSFLPFFAHGQESIEGKVSPQKEVATLLDGFVLEHIVDVPKAYGSWVALASLPEVDGKTQLAAADQYGDIYRITLEGDAVEVTPFGVALKGAHGLLWFQDSLYVVVGEAVGNERGVYRARDLDDDGKFEKVDVLRKFESGGEHGVHSLVPSPDGEWLYMVLGNYTKDSKPENTLVPLVWDEDQLLPRNPDGRGHASDKFAPGGRVLRCRPDGTEWTYVSTGYRNPFDGAFNEDGEFFVYDADMEWDMGMPWYRPTRLCWAMEGSEFGWRNGTGKWPEYYEDSLPGVTDFGPGSPVGVVSGRGAQFPEKYQRAIYCLDWTFATIYAVHLDRDGNGYKGEWDELLTATQALPLTDAVIGSDGLFYFATGGRRGESKMWRIRYQGEESTENAWRETEKPKNEGDDRYSRFQRRVEAELKGPDAVRKLIGKGSDLEKMTAVMGLARVGNEGDRAIAISELLTMNWSEFDRQEQLTWLRALGLVFIRMGEPSEEERELVLALIDSSFPHQDRDVEDELCRMLCYLQAPEIVSRTLALLAKTEENKGDSNWMRLVERGQDRYNGKVAEVLRELGSPRKIHLAYCLRVVKGPWTEGQRRQLMEWYSREEKSKAQQSAQLGLAKMRDDTLANATEEERLMVETWGLKVKRDPFANLPKAKGPARIWTVEEIAEVAKDLKDADVANGKLMFRATLCAACHRFGAEGGAAGPDLTNVKGRFTAEELAIAILEPSREISDQYEFKYFLKHDGSTVVGKVLDERDEILVIATNPFNFAETVGLSRADIKEITSSPVSPMPGALVNQLNKDEMKDLLGYLLGAK
ncbi:MAG: c-type cytochrome [Roseibacillus sp.]